MSDITRHAPRRSPPVEGLRQTFPHLCMWCCAQGIPSGHCWLCPQARLQPTTQLKVCKGNKSASGQSSYNVPSCSICVVKPLNSTLYKSATLPKLAILSSPKHRCRNKGGRGGGQGVLAPSLLMNRVHVSIYMWWCVLYI